MGEIIQWLGGSPSELWLYPYSPIFMRRQLELRIEFPNYIVTQNFLCKWHWKKWDLNDTSQNGPWISPMYLSYRHFWMLWIGGWWVTWVTNPGSMEVPKKNSARHPKHCTQPHAPVVAVRQDVGLSQLDNCGFFLWTAFLFTRENGIFFLGHVIFEVCDFRAVFQLVQVWVKVLGSDFDRFWSFLSLTWHQFYCQVTVLSDFPVFGWTSDHTSFG